MSSSSPSRCIVLATGIYPPEFGGPATYVRLLARWLKDRGHQPIVVTYSEGELPDEGWRVIRVARHGGPLMRYLRYAFQVWKVARSADLVYLQGAVSEGLPGMIGAVFAGKVHRLMMRVPGDYAWEMYRQRSPHATELLDAFVQHPHPGSIRVLERFERLTATQVQRVIVPSQYLKRITEAWGVLSSRIRVIYSAIHPLPSVRTSAAALRATHHLQEKRILFTPVRAVPWKGVDFLLEVLKKLPNTTVLCVAGDGPSLLGWKQLAHQLGLDARVVFLGAIDRQAMADWYQAADLLVLASGYEGFPHVVAEAVSVGLPCLVSDCGGNPETAQLFPGYVDICAYQDKEAWIKACLAHRPRREPLALDAFDARAEEVFRIMSELFV